MTDIPTETLDGFMPWHVKSGFKERLFRFRSLKHLVLPGIDEITVPVTITLTAKVRGETTE